MKNKAFVLFIIFAASVLFVLFNWPRLTNLSNVSQKKEESPSVSTLASRESRPEVVLLYQKGDGESDLALFLIAELEKENGQLANYKKVDVANEPEVATFYGFDSVPAFIVKTAGGQVLIKHEGYLDKASILKALKSKN